MKRDVELAVTVENDVKSMLLLETTYVNIMRWICHTL